MLPHAGVTDDLAVVQRHVRPAAPGGLGAQPLVERHPGAARERHVLVPLLTHSVVGRPQQLVTDGDDLDPLRDLRRRLLGANRARLLELVVDFVQARPASEVDRALVAVVDVRDDPVHVECPCVLSQAVEQSSADAAPAGVRQDAWLDDGEATEGREVGAAAADRPSVEVAEDQQAARRQAACDLLGRDGIVRLDAGLDRSPRLERGLVLLDDLDANAHGIGPCIVRARERVS